MNEPRETSSQAPLPDHWQLLVRAMRGFLWAMIASLTLGAGLAAVLLLAGVGDTTAWRIVVTLGGTAGHCGAAMVILKHARVHRKFWLLPMITMVLFGVNFIVFVLGHWFLREEGRAWGQTLLLLAATLLATPIWNQAKRQPPTLWRVAVLIFLVVTLGLSVTMLWQNQGEVAEKLMGSMWTLGIAASLISAVTQLQLTGILPMLRAGVIAMIVVACTLVIVAIVDDDLKFDHFYGRVTLVACILALCGSGTLEALRRLQGSGPSDDAGSRQAPIELRCAVCKELVTLTAGASACPTCATSYQISFKPSKCASCGYDMRQLNSATCPECGSRYA